MIRSSLRTVLKNQRCARSKSCAGELPQQSSLCNNRTDNKICKDVLFEIKFDRIKGMTFDGFKEDIVEIEIEVKEKDPLVSKQEVARLMDKSEDILMRAFADDLEPVFQSKVASLFRHLYGLLQQDKKRFHEDFRALPVGPWAKDGPALKRVA